MCAQPGPCHPRATPLGQVLSDLPQGTPPGLPEQLKSPHSCLVAPARNWALPARWLQSLYPTSSGIGRVPQVPCCRLCRRQHQQSDHSAHLGDMSWRPSSTPCALWLLQLVPAHGPQSGRCRNSSGCSWGHPLSLPLVTMTVPRNRPHAPRVPEEWGELTATTLASLSTGN